jgi:MoaA/NifB/PqqE/SkfB family radical SAM enzyme
MNAFISKLRFTWFLSKRALGFSKDHMEILYKIYLNHNKIIHYRNGYPVYSMFTPPVFSKPSANFMARLIYRNIQNKNLPNMMTYAVDDRCDATCEHCSFFEAIEDKSKTALDLEGAKKLVADAQELGVSVINFTGGEPLLRKDLPEIISSVDKNLSTAVIFTNGSRLKERARELKDSGLDGVYISLDFANAADHDRFRKKEGLFDKAIEGIQYAKKIGLTTGISGTLTPESVEDGEMERLIELGKSTGVHEVILFDALPSGRYKGRADLKGDDHDWIDNMIEKSKKYNADSTYPGVLVVPYMLSHRSVGCSCGTSYFYASPYGDIMSCDFNSAIHGNMMEKPLYKIWDQMTGSAAYNQAKWGGCKVRDPEYFESFDKNDASCVDCINKTEVQHV